MFKSLIPQHQALPQNVLRENLTEFGAIVLAKNDRVEKYSI
jgi:hypothetical protein